MVYIFFSFKELKFNKIKQYFYYKQYCYNYGSSLVFCIVISVGTLSSNIVFFKIQIINAAFST